MIRQWTAASRNSKPACAISRSKTSSMALVNAFSPVCRWKREWWLQKLTNLLLGLVVAASPLYAQGIERNWQRYPPVIATRSNGADIYAVGDAHSDYVRLSAALKAAGLIDDQHHWTGGRSILVSTGDMIDKGP